VFEIPVEPQAAALPAIVSLRFTERLCETYEAYRACVPDTEFELEELILLRASLAKGDIRLGRCRACKGLILINPYDGGHRTCAQCLIED
jgi:hypothetical protein